MRKSIIISFALLLLISCSNSSQTSEDAVNYNNLTVDEVITLWQSNPDIIVIDVRTPEEIAEIGAIEGSTNIDFKAADFKEKVSSLDKSKEYILFCRTGNRSGQASKIMADLGFSNVNNLNNAGYDDLSKALAK
ncbi:rhodanese-like domain-containing protein [Brachyspira sp. SAP_772]|uniref:rhodanese-like domain-containing protein n=1 Tax=Brachyspira sp. SAP_772 TaxID=2608385 RepID=UPI0012F528BD|nr:rhodanese-like domain-containing protein [Brachyspira sp. SAP_772]